MSRDEILSSVVSIINETLELDEDTELSEETSLKELGVDSFDKLELITAFEEEFEGEMSDEDLEKIDTIADIVEAIEKLG